MNSFPSSKNYTLSKNYVYLAQNAFPSLSTQIGRSVVFGSKVIPSDDGAISNPVIRIFTKLDKEPLVKIQ
jgi:hypothetical protein